MSPSSSQPHTWWTRLLALLFGAASGQPRVIPPSNDSSSVLPAAAPLPYRVRADFLSAAESSFLHVLHQAIGDRFWVCPKVNLADLFFVPRGPGEVAQRNRIAQKHVDVVLCDRHTLRPQLAIELDDRSHQRPDRVARDVLVNEVFAIAQLPLLRVPVQRSYNPQHLVDVIDQALPRATRGRASALGTVHVHDPVPFCPHCGAVMVLRQARRGQQGKQPFYGCPNYPRCRGMVTIAAA